MITANNIQYTRVEEPFWGVPKEMPRIPDQVYRRRLEKALEKMEAGGLDFLLVYADREHYGNFDYLTGYGPRFEEALLVIGKGGRSYTLLGNECLGLCRFSRIPSEAILCQSFSLPNQPIGQHKDLEQVFRGIGISQEHRVGLVGWKLIYPVYGSAFDTEVPSFIAESVRAIVGKEQAVNATDAFIHPEYGIRVVNDAHEIAYFEYGAAYASDAAQQMLLHARTGLNEVEISQFGTHGFLPTSTFPKVLAGDRIDLGMASPTTNEVKLGDRFQVSVGLIGGLTNRRGFAAYSEQDLPEESRDFLNEMVKPYFAVVANWYEMIGIGVSCGDLYEMVETVFPKEKYGWFLNPGHLIATEEWLSSPISEGSKITLKSGMCLQMDIIPSAPPHYAAPNCEDGLAIADESLRRELREEYPDVYQRIENRRNFMIHVLNIKLKPEVLPLSNLAGLYRPFMLNRDMALVVGA
ncbi:hypothetical protein D3Z51_11530 [Clostridiaceae bacterium]|nr:hypothetical protein [Clostridiaceae bacterium]RKI12852.1 hypothetical protein D7V81_11510 [bacterium 1XD21-70]